MSERIREDNLPESPYPGIDPFSYADRDVFFARETEARTLIRLIVMYRGVLLYSGSGTGKSSLVNSGLIPLAIEEGYNPERIRVQPKKGEEIVIERLSERVDGKPPFLPSVFASDELQERVVLSVEQFLETLSQMPMPARPLLIFDQFEEWITLFEEGSSSQTAKEVRAVQEDILDAIVSLVNNSALPVKVLIVLREDYLAKLAPLFEQCPNLPDQYLRLTSLKADQVYQVIRRPFEKYPEKYSPGVSDCLAKKIQTEFEERVAGADIRLTEVQIVCHTLFETGKQGPDLDQLFVDEGGVQGILEKYLKRALESLKDNQQDPAVALLSRMVTSAGTRNVISEDDLINRVQLEDGILPELLGETLNSLETETKLVRRELRHKVYYYEIASEFLVGWISKKAKERERSREQKKLEQARDKAEQRAKEQEKRAEEQTKIAMRNRCFVIVLLVVSLASVGFAYLAWNAEKKAENTLYTSLAYSLMKDIPTIRQAHRNDELVALMAVQAYRFCEDREEVVDKRFRERVIGFISKELRKTLETPYFSSRLRGHPDSVRAVTFSCNGKKLASGSADGTVRVWDLQQPGKRPMQKHFRDSSINSLAFGTDGKNLALCTGNGTMWLWDFQNPEPRPINLPRHSDRTLSVVFSPDGKKLASGSADGTVYMWDLQDRRKPINLPGHNGRALSLAFSPDGKKLASGSADKTVRLWDLQNPGCEWDVLIGHNNEVLSVAFSFDGKKLASGSADGTVYMWDLQDRRKPINLPGHNGRVLSLAFSPDGKKLASGSTDKTVRLWDLQNPGCEWDVLIGHNNEVLSVAFSFDGKKLASGSADQEVRVWDLQSFRGQKSQELGLATKNRMADMKTLVDKISEKVWRNLTVEEWRRLIASDTPYRPLTLPESSNSTYLFIDGGKNLARCSDEDGAVEQFRKALKIDTALSLSPEKEAKDCKEAWRLFEEGAKIGIGADGDEVKVENALDNLQKALKLDPDLDWRIVRERARIAKILIGNFYGFAKEGRLDNAIGAWKKARELDPTLKKSGFLLNDLCLWGSLWGKPENVIGFCNQAVDMDSTGERFRNSRGIARALTGDVDRAKRDFEAYLEWSKNEPKIDTTGPQIWLDALKKDRQITPEMVEKTRNQLIEMEELKQSRAMSVSSRQSAVGAQ